MNKKHNIPTNLTQYQHTKIWDITLGEREKPIRTNQTSIGPIHTTTKERDVITNLVVALLSDPIQDDKGKVTKVVTYGTQDH